MGCENQKSGKKCTCTYVSCERHGNCCQCVAYHRDKNEMVACYFTPEVEKSWDRSMDRFLSQYK